MGERIDILAILDSVVGVEGEFQMQDVLVAREALADLLEAARDCNDWLRRTDREYTAHQRQLEAAIVRFMD